MELPLIALVCAAGIGLALGLLGGGGSVLTVPVLVYIVGYDPKVAVAMSLGVVGTASVTSAMAHWHAGRINPHIAIPFGVITMAGSFVGARIGAHLSGTVQLLTLAVVTLIAAGSMLWDRPVDTSKPLVARSRVQRAVELAPVGAAVGLLTGIIGIGGGFLLVPALVVWGGLAMTAAVGTSLLVIALNCATGLIGYAGRVSVPWGDALLFIAIAVVFALIGSVFCGRIDAKRLRHSFAIFLIAVGVFVLYRNRATFLHPSQGSFSGVAR